MDNQTAKTILSAYRPKGSDSTDPDFIHALKQAEADPEMRDWLQRERAFDTRMANTLAEIRPPDDAKESLLATASLDVRKPARLSRWTRIFLPIAAILLIAIGIIFPLSPGVSWDPEGFQVARLADSAHSLDHMANSAGELRDWLREKGAPVPASLPALFETAQGNGCKIFQDGRGGQVSLLCFSIEGQLVHLFVFDDQTRGLVDASTEHWQQEYGWNVRALEREGQLFAVATRGEPMDFDAIW